LLPLVEIRKNNDLKIFQKIIKNSRVENSSIKGHAENFGINQKL
jgi:hypothetical protein